MELAVVAEHGIRVVEGTPDGQLMSDVEDVCQLIEACISAGTDAAILYPRNLTAAFFDLSSGQAGAVLQKLRNYRLRLAIVCAPGSVHFSSRFGEMIAEERRRRSLGVFETRQAALDWLGRPDAS